MAQDLEAALANPNAQKYLRLIAQAEGTYKDASGDPYRVAFGGGTFDDTSKHPGTLREFTQTDGKKNKTSAHGAYQFIKPTWDDVAGKLGLTDFGPRSQDMAALELIRRNGSLDDVLAGRFDAAVKRDGKTWASLPSSPYAQPKRSAGFVEKALNATTPTAQAADNPFADLIPAKAAKAPAQAATADAQGGNPFADLIPKQAPERSFTQRAGDAIRDIPRQVGLTGRYALEGAAGAAEVVTEPLRYITDRVTGATGKSAPLSVLATRGADALGLPKPQTAGERVIGDASRMVAGAGALAGVGGVAAKSGAATLGQFLGANPTAQLSSAAGSGLAGGAVRESGGSEGEQMVGAVLGGLAGAAVPGAVSKLTGAAQRVPGKLADLINPGRSVQTGPLDVQITAKLEGSGVDWSALPEKVRQSVRQDVQKALKVGDDLNPEALARMVDFRTVGATPTRGTVTLDPVQITQEKNLAKAGANSSNVSAQRLANIEADNNHTLVGQFGKMGAERGADSHGTGQRGIEGLQGWLDGKKAGVDALYGAARDSQGRSMPLDGAAFTQKASALLDEGLLGGALPKGVEDHLNKIAQGQVPFDVNYAEQLKTQIGKLQRASSDGSTRMALGMVRQALDDTPLQAAGGAIGENAAIGAFNKARTANREMMAQIEKTPALKSLYDGKIAPDDFLKKFITSPGAKTAEVQQLVDVVGKEGKAALRDGVLAQLRSAATSGAADETAKFSAAGFRRALDQLGDRKLAMFFDKTEMAQLKALSRVGTYTLHQPVGSAVNNSNSGAMLVGKGMDLLGGLGDKLKFAGVGDQLNVLVRGAQQSSAANAIPSLVRPNQAQPFQLKQLARPTGVSAGLFASPFIPKTNEDD